MALNKFDYTLFKKKEVLVILIRNKSCFVVSYKEYKFPARPIIDGIYYMVLTITSKEIYFFITSREIK